MDTTQKNREETARRPREAAGQPERPAQKRQPPRQQGTQAPRRECPQETQAAQRRPQEPQQRQRAQEPRQRAPRPDQTQPRQERQPRPNQAQPRPAQEERPRRQSAQQAQGTKRPQPPAPQPRRRTREVPDDLSAKKRAYGNSKPKKKTVVDRMSDVFLKSMERRTARKQAKEDAILRGASRSHKKTPMSIPTVIYTQPQAFNRSRMLVQLVTVTAVVLALVIGLSVFFKVGTIQVTGTDAYEAYSIVEQSGISEGDSLLTFSRARAAARIHANLPYVKKVSFGIKLPDTVNIIIEEEDVVYAVKDLTENWWLMNSNGRVVEHTSASQAGNHTQVLGVNLLEPVPDEPAVAAERLDASATAATTETTAATTATDPSTEATIPPVGTTGAEKLTVALRILKALEDNDIVGDAASVDVARLDDIILWYGTRYQVQLGDASNLEYKIACMRDVILQMSDYQSGVLDISFTIFPDKVVYTPFA